MSHDYKKLGFKCGLEIHQQLEGKKLFCECPTLNSNAPADIHFERRLRAVAGETGEIDIAAKYETEKSRRFIYEADSKDCCLVEMDEEPPHNINKDAVEAALQVAMMLKANIVDEIQVMRKTVIDGSNVSGFQRTSLIAYDGELETSKGPVKIEGIFLEEESAQKKDELNDAIKYRLDRLGIPLIEIQTDSSIQDPFHAKEAAEKIGLILRSTNKCKRGIGTIRQDVNVSIAGKNRVEIKGFQEIRSMPEVIEKEIERQLALIKKEEAHVRKIEPDNTTSFLRPMPGAFRMYPETDVIPFRVDLKKIKQELPELIEERAKRYEKLGINPSLAATLAKSEKAALFDSLVNNLPKIKPAFIAEVIFSMTKELQRVQSIDTERISEQQFLSLLKEFEKENISKTIIPAILADMAKGEFKNFKAYASAPTEDLEKEIKDIVKQKPGQSIGAYMGMIMSKFQGKVDGKKVMEILKKVAQ